LEKKAEVISSGIPVALKMMSQRTLEEELRSRKLNFEGSSRFMCKYVNAIFKSACSLFSGWYARRKMIVILAKAMVKEDTEGLKGDGYEFGRRFLSIDDYLYDKSDKELRAMLKQQFNMPTTPRWPK
jgi:hypothetical protein